MTREKDPKVSVVMTNFNGEDFLEETIKSVLSQSFQDFEFIMVDDGSTDQSVQKMRQFEDPRIRIIQNEKNSHVSYAHNVANRHVRGEYIACIDSDDLWKKDKLAKQYEFMEKHPEVGACFTQVEFVNEKGERFEDQRLREIFNTENKERTGWLHEFMMTGNHLANDSSMIRTEVMKEIGENNLCLVQLHDFEMWVKIALNHELFIFDEPLLCYRKFQGSGSISDLSWEGCLRSDFEFAWIIGNTIINMEPELFARVFHGEMKDPAATDEKEILCEKAILLSGDLLHKNCKLFAFKLFERIFREESYRSVLSSKYQMNQFDVYKLTGQPILYTFHLREKFTAMERLICEQENLIRSQNNLLEHQSAEKENVTKEIERMKRSVSWKITAPLRKIRSLI